MTMDVCIRPSTLRGVIPAIPSKSYAHRLLIAAALSEHTSTIHCSALSDDIWATVHCLNAMGADISYDSGHFTVHPIITPTAGTFDCAECGTTLRLLLPVVCALGVGGDLTGRGRLPERPLSPLYEELTDHGAQLSAQGAFPLTVSGQLTAGDYTLAANVSSQFISGLLFALPLLAGDSTLTLTGAVESRPYLDMTLDVLSRFGVIITERDNVFFIHGGQRLTAPAESTVEGDWSNAAFWLCAGALGDGVTVTTLSPTSRQGDANVLDVLRTFGATVSWSGDSVTVSGGTLCGHTIDGSQIPDLVPILCVVGALASGTTTVVNAQRLRIKESDRLATVHALLHQLGTDITQTDDGLMIHGGVPLTGGQVTSANDHRIAMACAIAAAHCDGAVTLTDAQAVQKSYPHFFDDYTRLGGIL